MYVYRPYAMINAHTGKVLSWHETEADAIASAYRRGVHVFDIKRYRGRRVIAENRYTRAQAEMLVETDIGHEHTA